ncbi:MAG TPA: rRNA adenine dimethyltransferase family protein [Ktedonobacterales bacterium]|nr:rRNA adenine dimethyltransferase family protein [Ktedonobacterales bacterium]
MSSLRQPNLRYSQNFLKSRCLVDRLLDTSTLCRDDVVYEIGPGKGIITERLARRCRQVIAIEKDPLLVAALRPQFARIANIRLHEGDFLEYRLPGGHYKVFASIPFTITSAIVTRLTTAPVPPDDAYLIMQKEAAERFLGVPRESLSGVLVKASFELEVLHRFRRNDFTPAPLVDVVMLRLCKRGPPLLSCKEMPLFRDFVVYGFTTPRPSLRTIFKGILTPRQCKLLSSDLHIDFDVTPTALCFEQWLRLFDSFTRLANPQAIHTILGSETRLRRQQASLEKMHRTCVAKARERYYQGSSML